MKGETRGWPKDQVSITEHPQSLKGQGNTYIKLSCCTYYTWVWGLEKGTRRDKELRLWVKFQFYLEVNWLDIFPTGVKKDTFLRSLVWKQCGYIWKREKPKSRPASVSPDVYYLLLSYLDLWFKIQRYKRYTYSENTIPSPVFQSSSLLRTCTKMHIL